MYVQCSRPPSSPREPSVLVVGLGALGCTAAALLARAGVVRLTLVDPDVVELSNLQRQLLYDAEDIGTPKVAAAAQMLSGTTPHEVLTRHERVDGANVEALVAEHDYVLDACDDPAIKFLLNRTAARTCRPYGYGGVVRTGGLAMSVVAGAGACLECAFPPSDEAELDAEGCHEVGILASVAGVIGAIQARQALGVLGYARPSRPGRMFVYEVRGPRWRAIDNVRRGDCVACAPAVSKRSVRRIESCHS